jgi:lysozyme family protein
MTTKHAQLIARNAVRWDTAKLTRVTEFAPVAKRLVASKARYQAVSAKTGVPWFVIAVIHQRESGQHWGGSLAQGDPWNEVSTHVPKGRGPFTSWEAAAIDALVNCAPYAAKWKDWSPGGMMTLLELYNGLGYFNRNMPSPYVWSGTDQYRSGKFVADGVFDASVVDKQLGCAGLILAMRALDPSIAFGGAAQVTPTKPAEPSAKPAKAMGIGGLFLLAIGGVWAFMESHPVLTVVGVCAAAALVAYIIKGMRSE